MPHRWRRGAAPLLRGLGAAPPLGGLGGTVLQVHLACMSRIAIAVPAGLIAFFLYVGLVLMAADHVLGWHWLAQVPFFVVAGIAWAFPAKWLMFWAAGQR
jgi:hypothetical protein